MKSNSLNLLSFFLTAAILLFASNLIIAQEKILGELTIENNTSAIGEQFVTINNERILSGRSIMSPAEIETPSQTAAKITLTKIGLFRIASGSKMNLYFDTASISGDLLQGSITIDALPFTKFNILTSDGAITASNLNNENVFVVNYADKKTQVKVLSGEVLFNGTLVIAGQTFPNDLVKTDTQDKVKTSGSGSNTIIFVILGVAAAAAVIAAVSLSGGNNDSQVSPIR